MSFKNSGFSRLMVSFHTVSADEDAGTIRYKVEFDNQSDCDITIGSTLLKQGSSNVNTLDWGNIEIPARISKTSSTHTFHFYKRESERYNSMNFNYNGLASCPD